MPSGWILAPNRSKRARRAVLLDGVAWLTNIPTPYRIPLWRAMAELTRTEIICLSATEPNREWLPRLEAGNATLRVLDVPSITTGSEDTFYLPSPRIGQAIRSSRTQVLFIDGWQSPSYVQALRVAHRGGMGVVASYRSTLETHRFTRGPVAWLRRSFFLAVDAVLVAGPDSAEAVIAMGVPQVRIVQGNYNVVDVEHYWQAVAKARARLPRRPGHHFLYVGQLVERKNLETMLRAWSRARERNDSFTLVGSGLLEAHLVRVIDELGLQGLVRLAGFREGDALIEEYAKAQTLVLPSIKEVWGLVVNEALAAGLHTVVSNNSGVARAIEGEQGVFLTSPDEESLYAALRRSRRAWRGAIQHPAALDRSPSSAATAVMQAAEVARRVHRERVFR
jgi:glycosyltransferase involved in cell wall biosynthesis